MTVDSAYRPVEFENDGDAEYPFEIEGIGSDAMQVYVVNTDETYYLLSDSLYALVFEEHLDPIKKRGKVILATPLADDEYLRILRKTPIETDFAAVALNPFPTEQLEYVSDKACYIEQEIEGHFCDCRGPVWPFDPPDPEDPDEPPDLPECIPYACDAVDDFFFKYSNTDVTFLSWSGDNFEGVNPDYKLPQEQEIEGITYYLTADGPSQYPNQAAQYDACEGRLPAWKSYNDDVEFNGSHYVANATLLEGTLNWTIGFINEKLSIPTDDREIMQIYSQYWLVSGGYQGTDSRIRWQHTTDATSSTARKVKIEFSGFSATGINDYNPYDPHTFVMSKEINPAEGSFTVRVYVDGNFEAYDKVYREDPGDIIGLKGVSSFMQWGDAGGGDDYWNSPFMENVIWDQDKVDEFQLAYERNFEDYELPVECVDVYPGEEV